MLHGLNDNSLIGGVYKSLKEDIEALDILLNEWETKYGNKKMNDGMIYAVQVVFFERGYPTKPYTYKSTEKYEIGDVLVVPTGNFYGVGKVTGCSTDYEFKENIKYRYVISKVEVNNAKS